MSAISKQGRKSSGPVCGGASTSQHLAAVPISTPIQPMPKNRKRFRSFPFYLPVQIDERVMKNASQKEELVPIRLDMELEG